MNPKYNIYDLGKNINDDDNLPVFDNPNLYNIFTLGFFDKYGTIYKKTLLNDTMYCNINSPTKPKIVLKIKELYGIQSEFDKENGFLYYYGINCFEFLSSLYDYSDPRYRKTDNYDIYLNWITFGLGINSIPTCRFFKKSENAIIPSKTEIGFDLHIISQLRNIGSKTIIYDTGIVIIPEFGFQVKLVPNIALVKFGYILSNLPYIINNIYKSTLKISLTKIDEDLPDIKLPFNCCQIVLERSIYYTMEEVKTLEELGGSDIFLTKIKSEILDEQEELYKSINDYNTT